MAFFRIFNQNSIRHRMLSGFLFLTFLILVLGVIFFISQRRTTRASMLHAGINQLQASSLNLIKTDNDFFDFESINEFYFRTRTSPYLLRRDSLVTAVLRQMHGLQTLNKKEKFPFVEHIVVIDSLMRCYNKKFVEFESLFYIRGFKNYGVEGLMRQYAHALEDAPGTIALTDVLTLRRNEKDFLLRHDTAYWSQFNALCKQLVQKAGSGNASVSHLQNLLLYQSYFNQRAALEKRIGLDSKSGLRADLNQLTNHISEEFSHLAEVSGELNQSVQKSARALYFILIASGVLFSILTSLWISRRLSEPIAELSRWMNLPNHQKDMKRLRFPKAADEIHTITESISVQLK